MTMVSVQEPEAGWVGGKMATRHANIVHLGDAPPAMRHVECPRYVMSRGMLVATLQEKEAWK